MDNIKYAIEGILFAAGEPVKAAKLAVVLDTSVDEVNKAVDELKKEYFREHLYVLSRFFSLTCSNHIQL